MKRRSAKTFPLARRELEFMNIVWDLGESTAQDVQDELARRGRKLRESTVRTILRVLEEKGFLRHRVDGRAYVYRAIFSREDARSLAVRDMATRLFGGSLSSMITYLLSQEKLSAKEKTNVRSAARRALRR